MPRPRPQQDEDLDWFIQTDAESMKRAVFGLLGDPETRQGAPAVNAPPEALPSADTESLKGHTSKATVPLKLVGSKDTVAQERPPSIRVYRCHLAQQGHSHAEERLYNALWHARQARGETEDTRLISIGWDVMGKLAGLTWRNAKANCLRLIEKLAMEKVKEHHSAERQGTTYRLYSYRAILQRRKAAGLEWVVRNRGGVTFVNPPTRETVSLNAPSIKDTVATEATESVVTEATGTVVTEDTVSLRQSLGRNSQTSSSDYRPVQSLIRRYLPGADDDAVTQLVDACRQVDPAASAEEICHFLELKIAQHRDRRHIANPVGLLITAVPKCFAGTQILDYRAAQHQHQQHRRQEAAKLIDDPNASPQELQWAREVLAE